MTDTVFSHPFAVSIIAGFFLLGIFGKLMKISFERITRWYLYLSTMCVVIVMNSGFFPFIGGKDYFFRFAVELALASAVLWWSFEAPLGAVWPRVKKLFSRPLVVAVSAFALMFLLASLFAYDVHAAFWSNFERGEGGFQMLHYYAFFLLLTFFFTEEKHWKTLFGYALAAAGIMILYGIAGNFGVANFIGPYVNQPVPTGFWATLTSGRFEGSLGNPAYVAPYLMFSMFYAAYLWLSSRKKDVNAPAIAPWGYGALIVVFLFFFILAQTRGAFLGLIAGGLVFLLYLALFSKGKLRLWVSIALVVFLGLGGIGYAVRNSSVVQSVPAGRLLQISTSDETAQTRFWVWGEAWKGFLERPILGWGPENFSPVFDKYFDPRFYVIGKQTETWFDRAHSVFFDYLSETGILGLLSYLAMFLVLLFEFIKRRNEVLWGDRSTAAYIKGALLIALPVAYLVQGVAIFDVLPMYLNVFMFLAFTEYLIYGNSQ